MAKTIKMSAFFSADLNDNYLRAKQSVRPEEVKAFCERNTNVRKDHCVGKPNSSLAANPDMSLRAAESFLVPKSEENHIFFNKFRRLYRLYKESKSR
jgi:hypothetical protein